MKYIFLDIDGVLATTKEFKVIAKDFQRDNEWARELRVQYPWNPGAVEVLNEILDATDAEIILSSDWKNHYSLEELHEIFVANGIKKSPIDITGNHPVSFSSLSRNRMSDIETYLKEKNFVNDNDEPQGSWIIIDDLYLDRYLPENLKNRFFITECNSGIKAYGLKEEIIAKLLE